MACYIPRWYTRLKTVTHPSTNRARRALTSFTRHVGLHVQCTTMLFTRSSSDAASCYQIVLTGGTSFGSTKANNLTLLINQLIKSVSRRVDIAATVRWWPDAATERLCRPNRASCLCCDMPRLSASTMPPGSPCSPCSATHTHTHTHTHKVNSALHPSGVA